MERIKNQIIEKVFLECFFENEKFLSIISLIIKFNSYTSILCSEENVFINENDSIPLKTVSGNFTYLLIEQEIGWLSTRNIVSMKYLIDDSNIKRGIIILFEGNHNIIHYNMGYDFDEKKYFS